MVPEILILLWVIGSIPSLVSAAIMSTSFLIMVLVFVGCNTWLILRVEKWYNSIFIALFGAPFPYTYFYLYSGYFLPSFIICICAHCAVMAVHSACNMLILYMDSHTVGLVILLPVTALFLSIRSPLCLI